MSHQRQLRRSTPAPLRQKRHSTVVFSSIIRYTDGASGISAAVARLVWDQEVGSSNLPSPTIRLPVRLRRTEGSWQANLYGGPARRNTLMFRLGHSPIEQEGCRRDSYNGSTSPFQGDGTGSTPVSRSTRLGRMPRSWSATNESDALPVRQAQAFEALRSPQALERGTMSAIEG